MTPTNPSLTMRLVSLLLKLRGNDFKEPKFTTWRQKIEQRDPPTPAPMPKKFNKLFQVQTEQIGDYPVYTLAPHHGRVTTHIIYTHGGAYVLPLQSVHWNVIRALIEQVGASVTVPLYPLAPEHSYRDAFPQLEAVYHHVLQTHVGQNIVLAGDSAGGGLALAQALRYRELGLPLPTRIVLFAPWLDIALSNPAAQAVEANDVVLGLAGLRACGHWWASGDDPREPLLSPIFGELAGLPPVDIFQGTADLFIADARLLQEKITAVGGSVRLLEYPQAFHAFMVATFMPEAKHVFAELTAVLEPTTQ